MSLYGLGDVGATLAARLPGVFNPFVMTNAIQRGGFIDYWYAPADTLVGEFEQVLSFDPVVGHFPYGRPVEPDAPM